MLLVSVPSDRDIPFDKFARQAELGKLSPDGLLQRRPWIAGINLAATAAAAVLINALPISFWAIAVRSIKTKLADDNFIELALKRAGSAIYQKRR